MRKSFELSCDPDVIKLKRRGRFLQAKNVVLSQMRAIFYFKSSGPSYIKACE